MKTISALAALLLAAQLLSASAQEARALAERMAANYRSEGFFFSMAAQGERPGTFRLLLPVSAGLEYLVLVAADAVGCNAGVKVEDESGRLLIEDNRPGPLAGVRLTANYDGTAVVTLVVTKAAERLSWQAMTGRRPRPSPTSSSAEERGVSQTPEQVPGEIP